MEFTEEQIIKCVQAITGEKYEVENDEKYHKELRRFFKDYIEEGMFIKFNEKEEEDNNEVIEHIGIVRDFIELDEDEIPEEYLKEAVRIEPRYSEYIYDVPINNLDYNYLLDKLTDVYLSKKEKELILYPWKKIGNEYEDIELKSKYNFSYEIEGGFTETGYEKDLAEKGYNISHDGSVDVPARYGELEIIVDGYHECDETLKETYKLLDYLRNTEFITNDSCGIHIHCSPTENERWDLRTLLKISKFYVNIEPYLYQMLPKSRTENDYSSKLKEDNPRFYNFIKHLPVSTINRIGNMEEKSAKDFIGSAWYGTSDFNYSTGERRHNTRYVGYNIHSVFYRNTLEFRHFDSEYNLLPNFLDLIDKIICFCKSNPTIELINRSKKIDSVEELLQILRVSDSTKELFLNRSKKFQNEDVA